MEDRLVEVGANYSGVSVYYQRKLVRIFLKVVVSVCVCVSLPLPLPLSLPLSPSPPLPPSLSLSLSLIVMHMCACMYVCVFMHRHVHVCICMYMCVVCRQQTTLGAGLTSCFFMEGSSKFVIIPMTTQRKLDHTNSLLWIQNGPSKSGMNVLSSTLSSD